MIDLGELPVAAMTGRMMDFGATLVPTLGGPSQRLRRVGARHAIEVTLISMAMEPDGRRMVARLIQAKQQGARMRWVQPALVIGPVGTPTVRTATAGGMTLPITGGTPGGVIREGQWLSLTSGGRSFLYGVAAEIMLNASGAADLALDVPLRKAAAVGDVVELTAPVIEGWIDGPDWSWQPDLDGIVAPAFTIMERA